MLRGVDLADLAVVWVPHARAAELTLRGGAFGLVAQDLGQETDLPVPAQQRLAALTRHHDAALL